MFIPKQVGLSVCRDTIHLPFRLSADVKPCRLNAIVGILCTFSIRLRLETFYLLDAEATVENVHNSTMQKQQ